MPDPANKQSALTRLLSIGSALISGLCFYISTGLSGDHWYLVWVAPVPVLIAAFKIRGRSAFSTAFIAYLIGRLGWVPYLASVLTLGPAIILTLLQSLAFSFVILATRKTVANNLTWAAVFAFPAYFTAFEFLLIHFSPDGSAASLAYSQANYLPLVQVASLTGILGITFIITLIPSVIALAWHFRWTRRRAAYFVIAAIVMVGGSWIYGFARLGVNKPPASFTAGLVALQEEIHDVSRHPDPGHEAMVSRTYAAAIDELATKGARLVVMPERIVNVTEETREEVVGPLRDAALRNHVFLVFGYTNMREDGERNSAMVIGSEGRTLADYDKVHLVGGLEDRFTPGTAPAFFGMDDIESGTAICKDLDFPGTIREYGRAGVKALCVPAWDFVKDDWLHSRMAILRGVENGFSMVRAAREGRLTISDAYGRVTAEANSASLQRVELIGDVPVEPVATLYTRFGDWFGVADLIGCLLLMGGGRMLREKLYSLLYSKLYS